jgi:peptidyl-tRNA hydrolase
MVQSGLLSPEVILKHDVHVTSVKLLSYIKHDYNREIVKEVSRRDVVQFLDYFCDQGLKEAVLRVYEGKDLAKVQERINQMPNVTSLIQLSRDVSRKIIIETFDIKTSQEFDSVLERLPVGDRTKNIIRFQVKFTEFGFDMNIFKKLI